MAGRNHRKQGTASDIATVNCRSQPVSSRSCHDQVMNLWAASAMSNEECFPGKVTPLDVRLLGQRMHNW